MRKPAGSRLLSAGVMGLALVSAACGEGYPVGPTDPAAVSSMRLSSPSATSLRPGETLQLSLTVTLTRGEQQDQTRAAVWSSTDISVATVNGTGLVTAVGPGSAVVRADFRGLSSFQTVEVR